jgi:hypothetical protein
VINQVEANRTDGHIMSEDAFVADNRTCVEHNSVLVHDEHPPANRC